MTSTVEERIYKELQHMIADGQLMRIPFDAQPTARTGKLPVATTRILNRVKSTVPRMRDRENQYIITHQNRCAISKKLSLTTNVITRALKRQCLSMQVFDISYKRMYTLRMLDAENTYMLRHFSYNGKLVDLIYDEQTGFINVSKFSRQFTVKFAFWRNELNGEEAIHDFMNRHQIECKIKQEDNEMSHRQYVDAVYTVDENKSKYEFARGHYIHPELFMLYVSTVHPILCMHVQSALIKCKIMRVSYLKCVTSYKALNRPKLDISDTEEEDAAADYNLSDDNLDDTKEDNSNIKPKTRKPKRKSRQLSSNTSTNVDHMDASPEREHVVDTSLNESNIEKGSNKRIKKSDIAEPASVDSNEIEMSTNGLNPPGANAELSDQRTTSKRSDTPPPGEDSIESSENSSDEDLVFDTSDDRLDEKAQPAIDTDTSLVEHMSTKLSITKTKHSSTNESDEEEFAKHAVGCPPGAKRLNSASIRPQEVVSLDVSMNKTDTSLVDHLEKRLVIDDDKPTKCLQNVTNSKIESAANKQSTKAKAKSKIVYMDAENSATDKQVDENIVDESVSKRTQPHAQSKAPKAKKALFTN